MSITLQINQKQTLSSQPLKTHYLPAKIDGDGEANVENFFNNYTTEENGYFTNSLRGYPLQGEELVVPNGYRGVVFQESREPLNEDEDRLMRVSGCFERFYYWNYDKIPSKADAYKQALQMINISEQLSTSFTEDDVLKEISANKDVDTSKEN